MKRVRDRGVWPRTVFVALLAPACGGTGGAGSTAPRPEVVGNEAVRARLASQPTLPVPPSTEIRALSDAEARRYCGWQAEALGAAEVSTGCPDGSTVRIDTACDDEAMDAMREGLAECPMTIGEWAACVAARRGAPCEGGVFGERLPECEAFAACITAALTADE